MTKKADRVSCRLVLAALILVITGIAQADSGNEVIVIYNTRVPESKAVAEYYATRRNVPKDQLFGYALSTGAEMSRAEFRSSLQNPLAKAFEDRKLWHIGSEMLRETNGTAKGVEWKVRSSTIRYAVICYGVPWRITREAVSKDRNGEKLRPEFSERNEASVDNELALLPGIERNLPLGGPLANPLYGSTNAASFHPTNGVLMVTRLDGPTAAIARGLVDKAIEAETNGLWGRAYIDTRSIRDPGYKLGDDWLNGTAEILKRFGFETLVDTNARTLSSEFPLSQVAFYAGWYDANVSGPFAQNEVEFMPGAFAYHLHSYSAADLRSRTSNWVGPLLARGATITMGSVTEPFLGGTPDIAVFAGRLTFFGFNFAEAAYASQRVLSWQTVAIGDPLYRPFGIPAQQLHQQLVERNSPWVDWSYLRLMNLNLAAGMSSYQVAAILAQLDATRKSAVLTEKLGDLYSAQGKPSSAVEMWQRALELDPSPLQRVRLRLELADKLVSLEKSEEALEDLEALFKEQPGYPGRTEVVRRIVGLARKLGKGDIARRYEPLAAAAAAAEPATPSNSN